MAKGEKLFVACKNKIVGIMGHLIQGLSMNTNFQSIIEAIQIVHRNSTDLQFKIPKHLNPNN